MVPDFFATLQFPSKQNTSKIGFEMKPLRERDDQLEKAPIFTLQGARMSTCIPLSLFKGRDAYRLIRSVWLPNGCLPSLQLPQNARCITSVSVGLVG